MDTLRVIFNGIAPLSTNETKSFNRNGRYFKNTKKDLFQKAVDQECLRYSDDIAKFKRNFNKKTEFITVYYKIKVPEHKFWNKDGSIKSTRIDLDNTFKCFQDRLFKNLGINDSLILDLVSDIRPSKDYKIDASISKMPINLL